MGTARKRSVTALIATLAFSSVTSAAVATRTTEVVQTSSYIVQAQSLAAARAAVRDHRRQRDARARHHRGAVAAQLTATQADALRARSHVDSKHELRRQGGRLLCQPTSCGRPGQCLHGSGITGKGVTIAFLDTGLWPNTLSPRTQPAIGVFLQGYDAILNKTGTANVNDTNGHGTHVISIATNSATSVDGTYIGIAPDAARVVVEAFDATGAGTYANVIRGLDWILTNRATYNIRVVNMSFGATPQSFYWNDPLAKAVMKLWQAGVVVVASAGNWGPNAQSITVPGNVPYVITVGAMTDNYTPANAGDDRLASFSSTGPTYEGFVKPEIVAPGGHVTGLMNKTNTIPKAHPEFHDGDKYFMMSGTSQAAAVVCGAVALMLQAQPTLTPNQVKCKLMSSARAAVDATNKLAYTVFQQGAGRINVYDAVYNQNTACANVGLDIAADLAGTKHYGGPARQKADGTFYVVDAAGQPINQQGYLWNNGYLWNQGYLWSNGYLWNNGYLWSNGYLWTNGYLWNNGYLWSNSFVPSTTSVSGVNHWVNQE